MKLSNTQVQVIALLADSQLAKSFYWTGGTLLAYHYLQHRDSLDLDFFSEEPFTFEMVNGFVQQVKAEAGFRKERLFCRSITQAHSKEIWGHDD